MKLFSQKKWKRKKEKEAMKLSKGKVCKQCGACCKVLSFPFGHLDTDAREYFLMHENISLREYKGKTHVVIAARCKHLTSDNLCGIHENKPIICRKGYVKERDTVVFQEGCSLE